LFLYQILNLVVFDSIDNSKWSLFLSNVFHLGPFVSSFNTELAGHASSNFKSALIAAKNDNFILIFIRKTLNPFELLIESNQIENLVKRQHLMGYTIFFFWYETKNILTGY